MLPGVRTRVLVVNEPTPPIIVPYTGPPFASAPWHEAHFASYTALPSATVPRPGGRPLPSVVRTSMFQAATSASLTAWPRRGLSGSGCTACGPLAPSGMPSADFAAMPPRLPVFICAHAATASAAAAIAQLSLADDIAHLAFLVHCPGLDAVVVLD